MRESEIQSKIIKYLETLGWLVVKIIQTNKNGWPDLQAHKNGITVFIEVKSEKGKASELQIYRMKKLQEQGFKTIIATSIKELQNEPIIQCSHKLC